MKILKSKHKRDFGEVLDGQHTSTSICIILLKYRWFYGV